ncbi:hypothetical protein VKT23_006074 [Stygiomarasmius scandens]|uniref:Mid2 domain-containing protein n=1 Tax=Marasmiellus scandens TaxID=2682957 RepID=A0ABR1JRT5_9AGAR
MKSIFSLFFAALTYFPKQGMGMEIVTTLSFYDSTLNNVDAGTLVPFGTAHDGSETTFELFYTWETSNEGATATVTETDLIIASANGFKDLYSVPPLTTAKISASGYAVVYECLYIQELCSESDLYYFGKTTETFVYPVITGIRQPWEFLISGSDDSKSTLPRSQTQATDFNSTLSHSQTQTETSGLAVPVHSFLSNKPAVIGTFTSLGIIIVAIILFLVIKVYRRKRINTTMFRTVAPWETADLNQGTDSHGIRPHNRDKNNTSTRDPNISAQVQNSFQPESSTRLMIQSTSSPTAMQPRRSQELGADDLRAQIRELQHAVNSSNNGMQMAMSRMLAHIQILESRSGSDQARGITDGPPPGYGSGSV